IINPQSPKSSQDKPVWEKTEILKAEKKTKVKGYLDYLTLTSRMIHLYPFDQYGEIFVYKMIFAQGRGPDLSINNPFAAHKKDKKKGYTSIKINKDRQLWRDYNSLFALSINGDLKPPLNLFQAAELEDKGLITNSIFYSAMCGGLASDQAKLFLWRLDILPLPLHLYRNQDFINVLNDAIRFAEDLDFKLTLYTENILRGLFTITSEKALKEAVNKILPVYNTSTLYWSELEIPFKELILACDGSEETDLIAYIHWQETCYSIQNKCKADVEKSIIGLSRGPKAIAKAYNTSYKEKK
ncbi:MAG: type I-E CRISPR-associated protein Cse1/CasA, partial [Ignavibacteriaceae bacterium]|nr:type I-E CRISPR-associated protein Cse1/CasA [Ignavibacteriaceae bacterium]